MRKEGRREGREEGREEGRKVEGRKVEKKKERKKRKRNFLCESFLLLIPLLSSLTSKGASTAEFSPPPYGFFLPPDFRWFL